MAENKKLVRKKYLVFEDGEEKLQYSSKISCEPEILTKDIKELMIYIGSNGSVPYATTNVQDDYADFESIAFAVWSILPHCHVILKFDELKWSKSFPIDYSVFEISVGDELNKKSINSEIQHYMRFLYRVMSMKRMYELFKVDEINENERSTFEHLFDKAVIENSFRITQPEKESGIKRTKKISENHLEKWFVMNTQNNRISNTIPEFSKLGNIALFDQFPCGLFYKEICESGRILNKGAFDLWGMNANGELCIFELKKEGNCGLGIISVKNSGNRGEKIIPGCSSRGMSSSF